MPTHLNVFPDHILLVLAVSMQTILSVWTWKLPAWQSLPRRGLIVTVWLALTAVETTGYLLGFQRTQRVIPPEVAAWLQASSLMASVLLLGAFTCALIWRNLPAFEPRRRRFLQTAATAAVAVPPIGITLGMLGRNRFHLNEVRIPIPNLPRDLQGLRLVQISDIHLSAFLSEREFERAIDMANEAKAHIALVTGDLITRGGDPLDACLRQLGRLRSVAGVIGCLGNHEVYTKTEDYVTTQGRRLGMDFLRNRARSFHFGNAKIRFGGVDYQAFHTTYLPGAEQLIAPGELNVLLSHNPDVFPTAAAKGFDLTIAGHTHGGQVNFEVLHENVNVALAFTPFVRGLYRRGNSAIYVSSGIGTIGVPVRIGAPAEVSLIELCAS